MGARSEGWLWASRPSTSAVTLRLSDDRSEAVSQPEAHNPLAGGGRFSTDAGMMRCIRNTEFGRCLRYGLMEGRTAVRAERNAEG